MWPFTKEKTIASAYTEICSSCNGLYRTVRWHDCTSYPINVKVYDVEPFFGFWCSNCDKKWGLNQKDFKKTLDNMHFLIKREFVDETARTLWAKEISTAMTLESFCKKYQRNFLDFSSLLRTTFGEGFDMLQEYEKLPADLKKQLCVVAKNHILNHLKGYE